MGFKKEILKEIKKSLKLDLRRNFIRTGQDASQENLWRCQFAGDWRYKKVQISVGPLGHWVTEELG